MQKWHVISSALTTVLMLGACGGGLQQKQSPAAANYDPIPTGRQLVLESDCGSCHGGAITPEGEGWLAGMRGPEGAFDIGPFKTRPRNLTPDSATGLGRYTDRQIFNALRYGLRPSETPDVEITSTVPGQGNFPANPKYLAPPMPWPSWRHRSDAELWAIVAYLKHAVKPVVNKVPDSDGPPDFWASAYTPEAIGPRPAAPYPTAHEVPLAVLSPDVQQRVLRGRHVVITHACGDCHGGANNPAADGFLAGMRSPQQEFTIGTFKIRPRNLTPDNVTGMGRFSERQIFNALRFGLRPGETPDVEITSTTPGQGNFPMYPKYLAPIMPWYAWRYMSDEDLWSVAAYLKHGLKPVVNRVPDSEGPPDFWVSAYTPDRIGSWPAPAFPAAGERTY